ncbi:MAG: hypothetical protein MUF55_05975 [Hydrogenophaga sp.]|jgi:hypothetical protein|nr:hypothetical protein [Hydrogenophaga sp.]
MKSAMPWLFGFASVAAIAVVVVIVGFNLDPVRSGTSSRECRAPAKGLLDTLLDVESQPRWRKSVVSVQRGTNASSWIETTDRNESITFTLQEANEQRVALAFTSTRGYEGRWLGSLKAMDSDRTLVVATEEVTIRNPIGRILSRLFFNPEQFASEYLTALCTEAESRARSDH